MHDGHDLVNVFIIIARIFNTIIKEHEIMFSYTGKLLLLYS
jgi:hypothetical protein